MLTCKEASHLMSEHLERPLGLWERVGLRMHLLMCAGCRRFERQIALLRQALRQLGRRALEDGTGPDLSPEARERIRKTLADQSDRAN